MLEIHIRLWRVQGAPNLPLPSVLRDPLAKGCPPLPVATLRQCRTAP